MATTNDDLFKKYNSVYGTGNNSSVSNTGLTSEYDNELSELARKGNYKSYFNKATQLANVNKLQQKYLQNSLKASGLSGTGAGTNASTQQNNAYLNASQNALSDYYTKEAEITEDAYNTYQSDQASEVSQYENMLSQYQTLDGLANAYSSLDTSSLGDEAKSALDTYYNNLVNTMRESNGVTNGTFAGWAYDNGLKSFTDETIGSMTVHRTDNDTYQRADSFWGVDNEVKTMQKMVGGLSQPTAFKLENSDGKGSVWVVYDPSSGTYYQVNDEETALSAVGGSGNAYYIQGKNTAKPYTSQSGKTQKKRYLPDGTIQYQDEDGNWYSTNR